MRILNKFILLFLFYSCCDSKLDAYLIPLSKIGLDRNKYLLNIEYPLSLYPPGDEFISAVRFEEVIEKSNDTIFLCSGVERKTIFLILDCERMDTIKIPRKQSTVSIVLDSQFLSSKGNEIFEVRILDCIREPEQPESDLVFFINKGKFNIEGMYLSGYDFDTENKSVRYPIGNIFYNEDKVDPRYRFSNFNN